jgi:hypothetical protein
VKYNLACGNDKLEGWVNVDIGTICQPDISANLLKPEGWLELGADSADEVKCRHFIEHIPHVLKHTDTDGLIWFMERLYELTADGCITHLAFPHPQSTTAACDPTHCRNIEGVTIDYFSAVWREMNDFQNYGIETDFEKVSCCFGLFSPYTPETPGLGEMLNHQWNIAWEIQMDLKTHKPKRRNA